MTPRETQGVLLGSAGWWSLGTLPVPTPQAMDSLYSLIQEKPPILGLHVAWLNDSPDGYQGLTEGPEFWLGQSQELEPTSMDAVHMRGFGPACGLTGVPWQMPPVSDTHIGISSGSELDPLPGGHGAS